MAISSRIDDIEEDGQAFKFYAAHDGSTGVSWTVNND
jgi:hypothetical protein